MLNWIIKSRITAFERKFAYDLSYARELLETDRRAFLAFARAQEGMGKYRKDVPVEVYYAVKLTGVIAEDCGPCTQLGTALALAEGIDPKVVAGIVRGDVDSLRDDVALGVSFARAVLLHAATADELREQIVQRWGKRALVSLAFALTMARVYPTLKYALGYGKTCERVVVGTEQITLHGAAA